MVALADVDLNLLVVLDALFEERNVTRAARRVGLTQPAVSNALARLRLQLSDPLFVRAGRGMVPTARAQEMQPAVRAALLQIEEALHDRAFDAATSRRVFRILTSDFIEAVLLPPLLRRIAEEAPFVDLQIGPVPVTPDAARLALEQGDADLALGVPVSDGAGIAGATLFSDPFVGLARAGHPDVGRGLTVERWAALPHVLVAPRGGRTGYVDTALAELGLSRRIHVRTPHFASAPQLLVGTDLVLTLPERAARVFARLWDLRVFTPPIPLPSVTFPARWHEQRARDQGHRWLRRLVLAVARTL